MPESVLDQTGFKVPFLKFHPSLITSGVIRELTSYCFSKPKLQSNPLKQQRSGRVLILMMRVKRGKASRQTAKFRHQPKATA